MRFLLILILSLSSISVLAQKSYESKLPRLNKLSEKLIQQSYPFLERDSAGHYLDTLTKHEFKQLMRTAKKNVNMLNRILKKMDRDTEYTIIVADINEIVAKMEGHIGECKSNFQAYQHNESEGYDMTIDELEYILYSLKQAIHTL